VDRNRCGLTSSAVRVSRFFPLCIAAVTIVAACGSDSAATNDTVAVKPRIVVSSTTDPQSQLFEEIYAQALEKAGFRVARKKAFDSQDDLLAAVDAGTVQLTALTAQDLYTWLQSKTNTTDTLPAPTAMQTDAIGKVLPTTMKAGAASTAEDKDVIFCSTTFTDANSVTTLTELGTKPQTATIAAPDGFDTSTPLGAATLEDAYAIQFKSVVPTEPDKIIEAVTAGTSDCGVGRSGDPALAPVTFTVLQDDKALVPNNAVMPVMSAPAATADVISVLDTTSAKLTTAQLRSLMQRLKDGASPELAANEFTGNVGD
jgi:osmoprotectant transport system substrate-binding protein